MPPIQVVNLQLPTPKKISKNVTFSKQLERIRYYRIDEPASNTRAISIDTSKEGAYHSIRSSLCRIKGLNELNQTINRDYIAMDTINLRYPYLEGYVVVKNLSFHKRVFVRYSIDDWRTFENVEARYESSDGMYSMDRFVFVMDASKIFFNSPKCFSSTKDEAISFAVCLECDGKEYWDSQGGLNYRVDLITQRPRPIEKKADYFSSSQNKFPALSPENPLILSSQGSGLVLPFITSNYLSRTNEELLCSSFSSTLVFN